MKFGVLGNKPSKTWKDRLRGASNTRKEEHVLLLERSGKSFWIRKVTQEFDM